MKEDPLTVQVLLVDVQYDVVDTAEQSLELV